MAKKELTFDEKIAALEEEEKRLRAAKDKSESTKTESNTEKEVPSSDKPLTFDEKLELVEKEEQERLRNDAIKSLEYDAYEKFEDENYNVVQRNITRPSRYGLNRVGEGLANTLEVYGNGIGDETVRAITPAGPENYIPASELLVNKGGEGFRWSNLPAAALEAGPAMTGTATAAAGGFAAGGPVGAVAAGTGFNTAISAGDNAKARAMADGRTDVNTTDRLAGLGTAAAAGVVETLPFTKGAGGLVTRTLKEAATEGLQSTIEQAGTTAGTAQGLTIDPKQAVAEAMIGAGAGAGIRPVIDAAGNRIAATGEAVGDVKTKGVEALSKLTDKTDVKTQEVDEYSVELKDMYKEYGNPEAIANPYDRLKGAKGVIDVVKQRLDTRINETGKKLEKLVKDNDDLKEEVATLKKTGKNNTGLINEVDSFQKLDGHFGNYPDYQKFKTAIILAKRNAEIRDENNLTGGIGGSIDKAITSISPFGNRFTPQLTMGDTSAKALAKDAAIGLGATLLTGGAAFPAAVGTIGAKFAISKIDKATNRHSTLKRFVDTIDEAQKQSRVLPKPQVNAELLTLAENARLEREAALAQRTGRVEANKELTRKNNAKMFENGIIPETEYHAPYKIWSETIGKNPKEILNGIQILEQQGALPQGTTERFETNIRSFSTKGNETYDIQEMVRQTINPEYSPLKAKVERAKKDPKVALDNMNALKSGISPDRKVQKAREGARRAQNVISEIENAKNNLESSQYMTLHKLKEFVDRPDMTALEREQAVAKTLSQVFDSPLEIEYWKKVFVPLAAIGNDYKIERPDAEYNPHKDDNQLNLPL